MEAVTSSIRALIGLLLVAVGVYLFSLTKKQKNASANGGIHVEFLCCQRR